MISGVYNEKILALPMPTRIRKLPVSDQGFPIPWFVETFIDGTRDFRIISHSKLTQCARGRAVCWICGEPLGKHRVFTIGPMCSINRVISEPPSHRECAEYSVKVCPFLANPRMRRNETDMPGHTMPAAGEHIARNPGAMALWETMIYRPFRSQQGNDGILFSLGEPTRVDWWARGRPATRQEVIESIDSGLQLLMDMAVEEGMEAVAELVNKFTAAWKFLPAEESERVI